MLSIKGQRTGMSSSGPCRGLLGRVATTVVIVTVALTTSGSSAHAAAGALLERAVFAEGAEGVIIGKQATVASGGVGSNGPATVRKSAQVGEVIAAGDVKLNKASQAADVTAGGAVTLKKNATAASVTEGAAVAPLVLPTADAVAGTEDILRKKKDVPDGALVLAPGAYGHVRSAMGDRVVLSSGEYDLRELTLKRDATLEVQISGDEPVIVRVEERLRFRRHVTVEVSGGGPEHLLFIVEDGELKLGRDASFAGTYISPAGLARLGRESTLDGALWGEHTKVKHGAEVNLVAFIEPGRLCGCAADADCDDDNPCTEDVCAADGECSNDPTTALCDDGDACTEGDACADGACVSGDPLDCDDGNSCTRDLCDAEAGCVSEAWPDGALCDDGDSCTGAGCDVPGGLIQRFSLANAASGGGHGLWLPGFFSGDAGHKVRMTMDAATSTMEVYEDGTALIEARCEVTDLGGGPGELGTLWDLRVELTYRGRGAAGEGYGGPKLERPQWQPIEVTDTWSYYDFIPGTATLDAVDGDGAATLAQMPADGKFPLQLGEAANGKNPSLGLSSWFTYTATNGPVQCSGKGDINVDLEAEVLCAGPDVCQAGTCEAGDLGDCDGARPSEVLGETDLGKDVLAALEDDGIVYTCAGPDGMQCVDVSAPEAPTPIGDWTEPGVDCRELAKIGDVVYLACGAAGIKCVDVTDPTAPFLLGTITLPAGCHTLAVLGTTLYAGVGSDVLIYDVSDPFNPLFRGTMGSGATTVIVKVYVDGSRVYCLYADGSLVVSDASLDVWAPVLLTTIAGWANPTDLVVQDGIAYCAFDGAGVYILDVRDPFAPVQLWHDGGSRTLRIAVRGRALTCAYADGRFITAGLRNLTAPQTLTTSRGATAATATIILRNGLALCAYGSTLSVLDLPPFVIGTTPRTGSTGACGDGGLDVVFYSELDPATVDGDSLQVAGPAGLIDGSIAVDGDRVAFSPTLGAFPTGTTTFTLGASIANARGTLSPLDGFAGDFTTGDVCVAWGDLPGTVNAPLPVTFAFDLSGGAAPDQVTVRIATDIDPGSSWIPVDVVTATGGPLSFTASWTAPSVTVATRYYAVVAVVVDGTTLYGPIVDFTVAPDPCDDPALDCDDGNLCTTDTCAPGIGCLSTPVVLVCTAGSCELPGSCDPATGACSAPTPAPEGTTCDDGDPETDITTCEGGACEGPLGSQEAGDLELDPEAELKRVIDDLDVDLDVAYAAAGVAGLQCLDVADPDNPVVLGTWSEPGLDCTDLIQIDDIVYLSCGAAGVKCVNVADPANPVFIGSITAGIVGVGGSFTLTASGNALFVAVGGDVQVWDVTDPLVPVFVRTLTATVAGYDIIRLVVDGGRIYCLYADGSIVVCDLTIDAFEPVFVVTLAALAGNATDLVVIGGIAYCAYNGGGVYIVDLTDLFAPVQLWWDGGSATLGISVRGSVLACIYADGRFITAGLRDLTAPQVLTASYAPGVPTAVYILRSGFAFCAYGSSLTLLEIPPFVVTKSLPTACGTGSIEIAFNSALDITSVDETTLTIASSGTTVSGSYAVSGTSVVFTPTVALTVATYDVTVTAGIRSTRGTPGANDGYSSSFDLTVPCVTAPVVGEVDLSGIGDVTINRLIEGDDGVAWAAVGAAGLQGLDLGDPDDPIVLGQWSTGGLNCTDLVRIGDVVYAACGAAGIQCVNVADPSNPTFIGSISVSGGASTVAAFGAALYIGVGTDVLIYDVSDPLAVLFVGPLGSGSTSTIVRVVVDGGTIYCLYADGRLVISDALGSPLAPVYVTVLFGAANATDIVVIDGIAYCAYNGGGVYIYDLRTPLFPVLLWWDGGSAAVRIAVGYGPGGTGRVLACAYADGRFLTAGLADLTAPRTLTVSYNGGVAATGVAILPSGYAFCAYGGTLSILDVPPYVLKMSPRDGSTGACDVADVTVWFSASVDPATVTAASLEVRDAADTVVAGVLDVSGNRVSFVPAAGGLEPGAYTVTVAGSVTNLRGTEGPADGFLGSFDIGSICLEWTGVPGTVTEGLDAAFSWQIVGATPSATRVLISTQPDPADPWFQAAAIDGSDLGGGAFAASWTTPEVDVATTYYALVEATLVGDTAYNQVVTFTVEPAPELETLVSGQGLPYGISVDDTHVYWANRGSRQVVRMDKDGGNVTIVAAGLPGEPADVAIGPDALYVPNYSGHAVLEIPKAGGSFGYLTQSAYAMTGLFHDGGVYWTTFRTGFGQGTVNRFDLASGTSSVIASGLPDRLGGLSTDGTTLWLTRAGAAGSQIEMPIEGGSTTTVVSDGTYSVFSAVDADYIYWGSGTTAGVRRWPRAGGDVEVIATGSATYGVAVDDTHVYYTDYSTGTVHKWAKPCETADCLICRIGRANCDDEATNGCEATVGVTGDCGTIIVPDPDPPTGGAGAGCDAAIEAVDPDQQTAKSCSSAGDTWCATDWSWSWHSDPSTDSCSELCSLMDMGCVAAREGDFVSCQGWGSEWYGCDTPKAQISGQPDIHCLCDDGSNEPETGYVTDCEAAADAVSTTDAKTCQVIAGGTTTSDTLCLLEANSNVYLAPETDTCAEICGAGGMQCASARATDYGFCGDGAGMTGVDQSCDAPVQAGDTLCMCYRGTPPETPDAGPTCTEAAELLANTSGNVVGLVHAGDGTFYMSSITPGYVAHVDPSTDPVTVTTIISGLNQPGDMAMDPNGDLVVAERGNNRILRYPMTNHVPGAPQAIVTGLSGPWGVRYNAAGDLFITNEFGNRVDRYTAAGQFTANVFGTISWPTGIEIDSRGHYFVAEYGGQSGTTVREFDENLAAVAVYGGFNSGPVGLAIDSAGDVYAANYGFGQVGGGSVTRLTPGGSVSVFADGLHGPHGIAIGPDDAVYVASYSEQTLRRVGCGGQTDSGGGPALGCTDAVEALDPDQSTVVACSSDGESYCTNDWSWAWHQDPATDSCSELCGELGMGCVAAREGDQGSCQGWGGTVYSCDATKAQITGQPDLHCICDAGEAAPAGGYVPSCEDATELVDPSASYCPTAYPSMAETDTMCLFEVPAVFAADPAHDTCEELCDLAGMGCILGRQTDYGFCGDGAGWPQDHACEQPVTSGGTLCMCYRGQP